MNDFPDAMMVAIETTSAEAVYPVPDVRKPKDLIAGPWMPGDAKPVREGRYLRYFDDAGDSAFSWWDGSLWCRDEFWKSDIQEAPWRGGVRPPEWAQILELIAAGESESSPQGFERGGRIARKLGLTTAQVLRILRRMEAAGEVEIYPEQSFPSDYAWRLSRACA